MLKRVFKAFEYHDFRLMWLGACTSSIGSWMQILAQAWLVYRLSNSSVYLGLDAFFGQIPIFLFSLFGGVLADRGNRRNLLIVSQVIQMTCAFILAALVFTATVQVWHIWCLSFAVGLAQSFGGPAYSALVPTLVDKRDLNNAIALNSIQFNLARVLGPMLGGIALSKLGATWCFALNGLSYLAVIATLLMIRTQFIPPKASVSVLASIQEGLNFIRKREGMVSLVAVAFFLTLLSYPLITFLPVMARDVFHGGANIFTLFLCLSGAGSVAGALAIAGSQKQAGMAKRSLTVMLVLGSLMLAFGLSRNLVASTAIIFCAGAALMVVFASNTSLVQLYVSDAMRGRVMSVYNVAFRGGMPIGSVVCGYLIKQTSAPTVMVANGVLVVLFALYFLLIQRRLAKL
ncbi:MAG TPA: MFS transporter [Bryobacteraceae bacterium]|nr:MFS transporter [Bryobacteraceae bacterium]